MIFQIISIINDKQHNDVYKNQINLAFVSKQHNDVYKNQINLAFV